MSRHMRKLVLEEENGLFFLPLEVSDGGSQVCDPVVTARANLAAASENLLRDAERLLDGGGAREAELGGEACAFVGANAATLELWHQRLGCSKQKISLMHKKSSALGLSVSGLTKAACKGGCMCSVCQLSRACKQSPAKMRVFEQ